MVARFMTGLAVEIETAGVGTHMNIHISGRSYQYGIHIAMLDGIATAATKMAIHTAGGPRGSAYVLGNLDEPTDLYMGIDLNAFLTDVDTFFEPFFSDTVTTQTYSSVTAKPLIRLHF